MEMPRYTVAGAGRQELQVMPAANAVATASNGLRGVSSSDVTVVSDDATYVPPPLAEERAYQCSVSRQDPIRPAPVFFVMR